MAAPSSIPTSYPRMASTPHAQHRLARTPDPHAHMHSPLVGSKMADGHKLDGVERQKGLGPLRHVSLSEAKARAKALSAGLAAGSIRWRRRSAPVVATTAPTFAEAALAWYSGKRWRSAKHSDQVISSCAATPSRRSAPCRST